MRPTPDWWLCPAHLCCSSNGTIAISLTYSQSLEAVVLLEHCSRIACTWNWKQSKKGFESKTQFKRNLHLSHSHCVRIGHTIFVQFEQITEIIFGKVPFAIFFVIDDCVWQCFLVRLPLENLLFDRSCCQQSINKTRFLLSVTPYTSHCLFIIRWIPVRIEHDQTISSDQIQTAATSLRAQHENESVRFRIVEFFDDFASFLDGHCAIETHIAVASLSRQSLE